MIEGNGIRSTERMTGIHRDTIMRLVTRTGKQCVRFLDYRIRGIRFEQVQADEIWSYSKPGLSETPVKPNTAINTSLSQWTSIVNL